VRIRAAKDVHRRWLGVALGVGLVLVSAAALAVGPAPGAAPQTAKFVIVAAKTPADGGYNFNGYSRGAMTVTVPVGWHLTIEFQNNGPLTHSLEVLPYTPTQPGAPPATPVFSGAATKNLQAGLPKGAKTTISFTADKPGTYEFACGVPGHAAAGMWDKLVVSAKAKQPSVTPASATKITTLAR